MTYAALASNVAVPHRRCEADFRRLARIVCWELHEKLENASCVQRGLWAHHHHLPEADVVGHVDVVVRMLLLPDCTPIPKHCSTRARFEFALRGLARLLLDLLLNGGVTGRPEDPDL